MNAEDKISACILRVRRKAPFFGSLALFLEQVLDEQVVTACTDGREVRFNPTFVESLAPAELDAVMIHEILHAALLRACGTLRSGGPPGSIFLTNSYA